MAWAAVVTAGFALGKLTWLALPWLPISAIDDAREGALGRAVELGPRVEPRRVVVATDGRRRPIYASKGASAPSAWLPPRSIALSETVWGPVLGDHPSTFRLPIVVDGATVFVDLRHTRLWTTVVEHGDEIELRQTIGVACDSPIVRRWRFDPSTHARVGEGSTLEQED